MKEHETNQTSFKKGHKTWNKGMRGVHFCPRTEFKKGQHPPHWKPVGSITVRNEHGRRIQYIKIAEPKKWIYLYKYIWLQINKKKILEKNWNVIFKDGNTLNVKIKNLDIVSRKEYIRINKIADKVRSTLKRKYEIKRRAEAFIRGKIEKCALATMPGYESNTRFFHKED